MYRHYSADKRGGGEMAIALEELGDCVSSLGSMDDYADEMVLVDIPELALIS